MTAFFDRTYYGNTVGEWLTTFLMILGAVILGRALYWVFSHSVKGGHHAVTELHFDDVLLDALEEPVCPARSPWSRRARHHSPPRPAAGLLKTVVDNAGHDVRALRPPG